MKIRFLILFSIGLISCKNNDNHKNSSTSSSINLNLIGDSLICKLYTKHIPLNKIVFDSLKSYNLNVVKIESKIDFKTSKSECELNDLKTQSFILKMNNGYNLQFIRNQKPTLNHTITIVNNELFKTRALLGEMFEKDSEIYFHYDSGELYKLSNGNLLYVEQPESWCGKANNYDFYQYFDLNKKEIIQFVAKDNFIDTLK